MVPSKSSRAVIICSPDGFANAVKPTKLTQHLEAKGYRVEWLPIFAASRLGRSGFAQKLPGLNTRKFYTYALEALCALARLSGSMRIIRYANSLAVLPITKSLAVLLHKSLKSAQPDLVICESNLGIGFVDLPRVAVLQILDLPAPGAEEMHFGGELSEKAYQRLNDYEIAMYAKADALAFQWHKYADFVKQTKYNGKNFIDLSYGTTVKKRRARYTQSPKIIFLGLLSGAWVNTPLLEKLCQQHPNIDVYGGPKPPKGSKINYKGYAPSLDVMADYQFGLITITNDPLRQQSFSSKHLEYISYGLPVFTPNWRRDRVLDSSSIFYADDKDFTLQLQNSTTKQAWYKKNKAALATAKKLDWEHALAPLDKLMATKGLKI